MVSDEQVAALRAFLALDADEAEFLTNQLVESNHLEGYGELISSTFAAAIRRRFSPDWKIADVIRVVASTRGRLINEGIEIDTRAAEILIRRTPGEKISRA